MDQNIEDRLALVSRIIEEHQGIRLDIACGGNKQQGGFVGMDIRALPGVDIVHNCEETPWPLPDESVIMAVCFHYIEHINPHNFGFVRFMDEVWRVMKVDAEIAIVHPHGSSQGYLQDPTHCNACNEQTWTYFDPEAHGGALYSIYQPKPWRVKYIEFNPAANVEVVLVKRSLDWREKLIEAQPMEVVNVW